MALSRQDLPYLDVADAQTRREGVFKGRLCFGARIRASCKTIIMATGSEVQLAVAAAKELGAGVRVVSMPCLETLSSARMIRIKEFGFAIERDAGAFRSRRA